MSVLSEVTPSELPDSASPHSASWTRRLFWRVPFAHSQSYWPSRPWTIPVSPHSVHVTGRPFPPAYPTSSSVSPPPSLAVLASAQGGKSLTVGIREVEQGGYRGALGPPEARTRNRFGHPQVRSGHDISGGEINVCMSCDGPRSGACSSVTQRNWHQYRRQTVRVAGQPISVTRYCHKFRSSSVHIRYKNEYTVNNRLPLPAATFPSSALAPGDLSRKLRRHNPSLAYAMCFGAGCLSSVDPPMLASLCARS